MKSVLFLLIVIAILLVVMDIAVIYAARKAEKKERELFEKYSMKRKVRKRYAK